VHAHFLRIASRTPFAAGVLEIADQFLFFVSTEIAGWFSAMAVLTAANSDAIRPPIERTCSFGAAGRPLR
jgi:hypothetical protein